MLQPDFDIRILDLQAREVWCTLQRTMKKGSVFTASSTRRRIFEELEKIKNDPSYTTTVTHRGKPIAIFLNYSEYLSWKRTLAIAADPLLVQDLKSLQEAFKAGKILTYEELFGKPQPRLGPVEKGEIVYRVRHGVYQEES